MRKKEWEEKTQKIIIIKYLNKRQFEMKTEIYVNVCISHSSRSKILFIFGLKLGVIARERERESKRVYRAWVCNTFHSTYLSHTQFYTKQFLLFLSKIDSFCLSLQHTLAMLIRELMHSHLRLAMYRFAARRVCLFHGTVCIFFFSSHSVWMCLAAQRKQDR